MRKLIAFTLVSTVLVFTACKKDQDDVQYASASKAFTDADAQLQTRAQNYTINISNGTYIIGEKGTRVQLYPNSLVDANGTVVQGNVNIELKELYRPGAMILSNKTTTTSSGLLTSGGEVYVRITQNSRELKLRPGYQAQIGFPNGRVTQAMSLYYGRTDANDNVTWTLANNPQTSTPYFTCDSVPGGNELINPSNQPLCDTLSSFASDSLGWMNCDQLINITPNTNVTVDVPEGYTADNTRVYAVIHAVNSVTRIYYDATSTNFVISGGYRLPIGYQVTFVALHYDDATGQWLSAVAPTTIQANHVQVLNFTPTTVQQFQQVCNGL